MREQFQLEVLVPPQMEETIETAGGEAQPLAKREGEMLQLSCPLKPTLTAQTKTMEEELRIVWSKDGRPLEPELNPNIEVVKDNL